MSEGKYTNLGLFLLEGEGCMGRVGASLGRLKPFFRFSCDKSTFLVGGQRSFGVAGYGALIAKIVEQRAG